MHDQSSYFLKVQIAIKPRPYIGFIQRLQSLLKETFASPIDLNIHPRCSMSRLPSGLEVDSALHLR